jgi:phage-related protein
MVKKYTFEFADINGKNEIKDFLEKFDKYDKAKIFAYIFKLIEILNLGLLPKETLSKHIKDGIYELRVPLKNRITRLLYFVISGNSIIFTNGFIKKTQKLSLSEID